MKINEFINMNPNLLQPAHKSIATLFKTSYKQTNIK